MIDNTSFVTYWGDRCRHAGTIDPHAAFDFDEAAAAARAACTEGMVLLKNEDRTLPLTPQDTVAVFGSRQLWDKRHSPWGFLLGGAGAGSVWGAPKRSPLDALRQKAEEGKFTLYDEISQKYAADPTGYIPSAEDIAAAQAAGVNKALYIVSRLEGEGGTEETWLGLPGDPDSQPAPGQWYLSGAEKDLLCRLSDAFAQVIVVFNTGNLMDTGFVKNGISGKQVVDGALAAWYGGHQGPEALADVLAGDANPAGKLVQTSADIKEFPSTAEFGRQVYSHYTEDVFVGYRYFETFDPHHERVYYEFGHGLSYTTFALTDMTYAADDAYITVTVTVTNTGDRAGKEVVQVYFGGPQMGTGSARLSKPARELVGFQKTRLLAPKESETVTVTFPIADMASYDDTGVTAAPSAWVLEAGDYTIYAGNSVKNAVKAGVYTVHTLTVVEQLSRKMAPHALQERLLADGTYEQLPTGPRAPVPTIDRPQEPRPTLTTFPQTVTFDDVVSGKHTLDELVSQMTEEELASFAASTERKASSQNAGVGGNQSTQKRYGIPVASCLDGPAGPDTVQCAFPSGICLASTWDLNLAADCGSLFAAFSRGKAKGYRYGSFMWQGAGLNIHRNPLGGRNFEYYSEDPLITGLMAAATTLKVQQRGDIGMVVKHLAANNQETARGGNDSRVSERALREIYLKGFEIALKLSDPVSIMTSYNKINGYDSWEYTEMLIDVIRKEWGWKGMYMSDWDDVGTKTLEMVLCGHNIKMGGNEASRVYWDVVQGYEDGKISRALLIENAKYVIGALLRSRNEEEGL
ncbi:MAG: glycoside hydrolase family 3 C-terminal domain-containing protein [Clostridia bacterium]|nr:glycoside hydrolase family 3 C-terminal domain-containing protein [Clostridia bacterium]